jgi:hypothetical protein
MNEQGRYMRQMRKIVDSAVRTRVDPSSALAVLALSYDAHVASKADTPLDGEAAFNSFVLAMERYAAMKGIQMDTPSRQANPLDVLRGTVVRGVRGT